MINSYLSVTVYLLWASLGLYHINQYIWARRSHMLDHISNIMSSTMKFKCTKAEQDYFNKIKRIVVRNNLSTYPYLIE